MLLLLVINYLLCFPGDASYCSSSRFLSNTTAEAPALPDDPRPPTSAAPSATSQNDESSDEGLRSSVQKQRQ